METSNAVTPVNHLCPNLLHLFTAGDVTADPHHHRVGSTRPSTVTRRRRLPCHRSPRSTVARQCRGEYFMIHFGTLRRWGSIP
uniref:Uncharacterized protein n=1 Tax=Brassica oleracea TaxID=3712 RepID=A0A3P6FZA5_BRAOL|nr:unnamed protein product [Brassica oleracea]